MRISRVQVFEGIGTVATAALCLCLVAFCAGYVPVAEEFDAAEPAAVEAVAEVVEPAEEAPAAESDEPAAEILEAEEAEDEAVEVPVEEAASSSESSAAKSKKSANAAAEESASDAASSEVATDKANSDAASGAASDSVASATITVTISVDASRAGGEWPATMAAMELTLEEGATVYDALVATGLALGGSSSYISSIGGLAEFMCGSGSGWMYAVDGAFPNKSCGKYVLAGGESIQWIYTCALGKDIEL